MKKKILAVLLACMMVVTLLPLAAFAEEAEDAEEVVTKCPGAGETHTLANCTNAVVKATVKSDCTAWGYTVYECSVCGDAFADDFDEPTKAHTISNPTEEAIAPTCTVAGKTAAGVCDVCGTEVKSEPVAATGHKKAADDKGTACKTESGACGLAYKCTVCGETFVETNDAGHVWNSVPTIVTEPGYYTWGEAEYTCTACSATKIVPIRPEHKCTDVTAHAAVAATCESDGKIAYWQCNDCKVMYSDADLTVVVTDIVVPALGHDFDASYNVSAGKTYTLTPDALYTNGWSGIGTNLYACLTDGVKAHNKYYDINYMGWSLGGKTASVVVNLTKQYVVTEFVAYAYGGGLDGISAPASVTVAVSVNGTDWIEVEVEAVETTTNVVDNWGNKGVLSKYTISADHLTYAQYVKFSFVPTGNFVMLDEVEVYGYQADDVKEFVPSTCVKNGYQVVKCGNGCDKTETQKLPLAYHEYDPKPIMSIAPTCEKYGFDVYACTVCGDIKTVSSIAPIGHTPYACPVHTDKADDKCEICASAAKSANVVITKPTCTANGLVTWTCGNCNEEQTEVLAATGHNKKTITVPATCHQYGYSYTVCTNEGCDGTHVKPSVGFGENGVIVVYYEKDGVKYILPDLDFYCCFEFTVDVEGGLDPDNHTRDNSKSYWLVEPTCTTGGTDVFFCAYCSFYKILDVDALGHDFTIGTDNAVYTEATCTEAGYWTVTCAKGCTTKNEKGEEVPVTKVVVNEKAPALGHEYADSTKVAPTVTAPTCKADGYKFYDCLRCSSDGKFDAACDKLVAKLDKLVNEEPVDGREEVFNSKVAAEAVHSISSWKVLRKGDCQLVGLEVAKCSTCGLDILAVIPNTGHHVAPDAILGIAAYDDWNEYASGIIAFTSQPTSSIKWWAKVLVEYNADYNYYEVVAVAANETDNHANWTVASNQLILAGWSGNASALASISALKVGDIVIIDRDDVKLIPGKAATCLDDGYTAEYTCLLCGELVTLEVIKAKGAHTLVTDVAYKAPTCTEKGATMGQHCVNCDYKVESEELAATGHGTFTLVLNRPLPTCTEFGFTYSCCEKCGYEEIWWYKAALGHEFTDVEKAVGCLTDGTLGCTRCDATKNVEAQGHVMTVKDADGKETEVYYGFCDQTVPENNKCEVCEAVVKADAAPAHRQTSLNVVVVDPTCVEYGYILTTCDDCDYYSVEKIAKLAEHKIVWDDEKYVAPTFHEAGSKTGTCSVCKGEFTEEVKALEGLGYFVSLDNAVVAGADLVDSATLAVTISLDGNNADVWGVRFNVEYDKAVLKFDSYEFVCDAYNVLGEVNNNDGFVTVVANMSNKDAAGVANATINAETSFVVLYFTVDTGKKVVEDSVVEVVPVEAINAKSEAVAVNYAGSAEFDVAAYLDVDEDGNVTLADALIIYNIISNGSIEYIASADVDKDGVITLYDFIAVYKYLSGELSYADMLNGGVKVETKE